MLLLYFSNLQAKIYQAVGWADCRDLAESARTIQIKPVFFHWYFRKAWSACSHRFRPYPCREWAARATKREYAVVFRIIFMGRSTKRDMFPHIFLTTQGSMGFAGCTCEEIARNGFKKIVIINGHGGNPQLIRYFMQTQLDRRRNYAIFF